uniref:Glutaminase n=1 Tax=Strongyloides venezuelensis TaxID=75913 RepID=A0A0K0FAX3_STRVS
MSAIIDVIGRAICKYVTACSITRDEITGEQEVMNSLISAASVSKVAAFSLTCGLHFNGVVVSHADEGSQMRSILTRGKFTNTYGSIIPITTHIYFSLPYPSEWSEIGFTTWIDGILMKTAASVALSDLCA